MDQLKGDLPNFLQSMTALPNCGSVREVQAKARCQRVKNLASVDAAGASALLAAWTAGKLWSAEQTMEFSDLLAGAVARTNTGTAQGGKRPTQKVSAFEPYLSVRDIKALEADDNIHVKLDVLACRCIKLKLTCPSEACCRAILADGLSKAGGDQSFKKLLKRQSQILAQEWLSPLALPKSMPLVKCLMLDWMHCYVVSGLFHVEASLLLPVMHVRSATFLMIQAFISECEWPHNLKNRRTEILHLFNKRTKLSEFKAGTLQKHRQVKQFADNTKKVTHLFEASLFKDVLGRVLIDLAEHAGSMRPHLKSPKAVTDGLLLWHLGQAFGLQSVQHVQSAMVAEICQGQTCERGDLVLLKSGSVAEVWLFCPLQHGELLALLNVLEAQGKNLFRVRQDGAQFMLVAEISRTCLFKRMSADSILVVP
ncbi:unnamed protein product [Symbiodinium sp. CCMP2592]|nr:unnamed protein product [Symbiodinium sp. CCMP2592]